MVGYVGLVGLVWFVLEGSKSNTVSHSLSHSKQSPKVGIELLGQLIKIREILYKRASMIFKQPKVNQKGWVCGYSGWQAMFKPRPLLEGSRKGRVEGQLGTKTDFKLVK